MQDAANSFKPQYISDLTQYAELGVLIAHLHREGLIDTDVENICINLDENLIRVVPLLAREKLLDLFGGVVSVGMYYFFRYKEAPLKYSRILSEIVDVIYNQALLLNEGIAWSTIINTATGLVGFNLGLAHGVPGVLAFLLIVFSVGISVDKTKFLIHGTVSFFIFSNVSFSRISFCFL